MGWLIDAGTRLEPQFLAMAVYTLAVAALSLALQPRLRATAEA